MIVKIRLFSDKNKSKIGEARFLKDFNGFFFSTNFIFFDTISTKAYSDCRGVRSDNQKSNTK